MREKGGKKRKLHFFSGNTAFRVHFSFDVGLNTVFITQINFICLLFISYDWTSSNEVFYARDRCTSGF